MLSKADPNYKESPDIKWNFTKFLINKRGQVVARFEPTEKFENIAAQIEKLLHE
jgi:glutathione peroxidase